MASAMSNQNDLYYFVKKDEVDSKRKSSAAISEGLNASGEKVEFLDNKTGFDARKHLTSMLSKK